MPATFSRGFARRMGYNPTPYACPHALQSLHRRAVPDETDVSRRQTESGPHRRRARPHGATSAESCRWNANTPTAMNWSSHRSVSTDISTSIIIPTLPASPRASRNRISCTSTKNPTTWQLITLRRRCAEPNPHTRRILFFSWQNILRHYPPPFAWMEQYVYQNSNAAIAGSREAETILRARVSPSQSALFHNSASRIPLHPPLPRAIPSRITIGYAGRLVHEKGIEVLLQRARHTAGRLAAENSRQWSALLTRCRQLARELANRRPRPVSRRGLLRTEMPQFYNSLDILVVPSLTQPNWKEQFGRVIMEAMACGVPVIGSDSGEIPNVIGDAGVIVPENDPAALTRALADLIKNPHAPSIARPDGTHSRAHSLFTATGRR